jgi:hypothetical protein
VTAIDPDAPDAPVAPDVGASEQRQVQTFVLRREGEDGNPQVRHFTFQRTIPNPPLPAMPPMAFPAWGDPDDPEFEKRMEEWGAQMEKWGGEYGAQWERWAEEHEGQALAWAEQARRAAPEVVHSCDENESRVTADGRPRVVICQREIERQAYAGAHAGLRQARTAIATNQAIDEEVRREILQDLDEEIERIERGED